MSDTCDACGHKGPLVPYPNGDQTIMVCSDLNACLKRLGSGHCCNDSCGRFCDGSGLPVAATLW